MELNIESSVLELRCSGAERWWKWILQLSTCPGALMDCTSNLRYLHLLVIKVSVVAKKKLPEEQKSNSNSEHLHSLAFKVVVDFLPNGKSHFLSICRITESLLKHICVLHLSSSLFTIVVIRFPPVASLE